MSLAEALTVRLHVRGRVYGEWPAGDPRARGTDLDDVLDWQLEVYSLIISATYRSM